MFTTYSQYVHYIFTIYSLDVHWMFTIDSLYVHHMFTVHSRYIYWMCTICSLDVHCMFNMFKCSLYVHHRPHIQISNGSPWHVLNSLQFFESKERDFSKSAQRWLWWHTVIDDMTHWSTYPHWDLWYNLPFLMKWPIRTAYTASIKVCQK